MGTIQRVSLLARIVPGSEARFGGIIEPIGSDLGDAEVALLALPHGVSQTLAPKLLDEGRVVVDLGADFRFADEADYEFGIDHTTNRRSFSSAGSTVWSR